MESVNTTINLRSTSQGAGKKPFSLKSRIIICVFLIILVRIALIGLTALLDIFPVLAGINTVFKQINSLTYLVAVPVGIGLYKWMRIGNQDLLLETITNLFRKRSGVLGIIIVSSLILVGDFAPQLAPYDPIQSMIGQPGEKGKLPGKGPCTA